jgi:hypothetical protein
MRSPMRGTAEAYPTPQQPRTGTMTTLQWHLQNLQPHLWTPTFRSLDLHPCFWIVLSRSGHANQTLEEIGYDTQRRY